MEMALHEGLATLETPELSLRRIISSALQLQGGTLKFAIRRSFADRVD